ncbi:MAG: right-handed parallel beta-helix repeat-containing protein [Chloroflexi bacterium]|nr:right-handed parallel beta-helix repeat-containing protein [Chloroflexota bacterium]
MPRLKFARFYCLIIILATTALPLPAGPTAVTYYVSSSTGSDSDDGLSEVNAFKTLARVNALNLLPGDRVLFSCGEVWQAEQLILSKSGTELAPIVFGSYPAGCANKPILSGSRSIGGWTQDSDNVFRAELSSSDFPLGINQLFRNGQRLTLGRWPNLNDPAGGYSFVDAHSAGGNQITDNELPAIDWTGAIVHIKNIRWSMLDRQVTGTSDHALTLNQGLSCLISSWSNCVGWGYFINNHRAALDQDGEWYYDPPTRRVYLYSMSGMPGDIEGAVIQEEATTLRHGGLMLSNGAATAYVIVDNLEIKNWFNHGIGTPGGMNGDIYHHLTVRNVTIKDVDNAGVNLSSWLERPSNGRQGLRGGDHLTFTDNVIDGANSFGITGYFAASTFEGNTIKHIALIENLGKSGMSCGLTSSECTENGDGLRSRLYDVRDSGYGNTLRYNRFEQIGYNGVDVFGPDTTLEKNFITQACATKADCGGVRTFGSTSLAATTVYNVHLIDNLIVDIPGNVEGCHPSRAAFGMGLYIDHYSRDVETRGNTVISTTITGILYQRSTGQIVGNTVFDASTGIEYSAHISLGGDETRATIANNVLYGLNNEAWTLYARSLSNFVSSDYNYLFHPYVTRHIAYGPAWTRYAFGDWKTFSGLESHSTTNWFTQPAGEASRGKVFYNATKTSSNVDLGDRQYLDLDQKSVVGSLTLSPFASKILIDNGPAQLTLTAISPALSDVDEPTTFTLTANGVAFTPGSTVRWNGSARPTTFISSNRLIATIDVSDVSVLGDYPVTIYDPAPIPTGTVTVPLMFHVVTEVFRVYLPVASKGL